MKKEKILSFVCATMMIGSLSACGKAENNGTEESNVSELSDLTAVTTVSETTTEETTTTPEPVFVPCPDVTIDYIRRKEMLSYYGYEYFIRNHTDKVIIDIELAIMPLDENFLPMLKEPITDYQENINILPSSDIKQDEKTAILVLDTEDGGIEIYNGYRYYTAVVSYVKFRDGSEWKADNLQLWVDDVNMNYSKEDWIAEKEKLKENAVKAESNEYLHNLTDIRIDDCSGNNLLLFKTPDNLDEKVSSFKAFVMLYDENGKYLDYSLMKIKQSEAYEFDAGASGIKLSHGVGPNDLGYTKNIIFSIEFSNGESWSNPYSSYWINYYEDDLEID